MQVQIHCNTNLSRTYAIKLLLHKFVRPVSNKLCSFYTFLRGIILNLKGMIHEILATEQTLFTEGGYEYIVQLPEEISN